MKYLVSSVWILVQWNCTEISLGMIWLVFFFSTIESPVVSLTNGVPSSACIDGIPRHFIYPVQSTPAPYDIIVEKREDERSLKVTIKGKTARDTIKGFLIQAKIGKEYVGQFELLPGDDFSQIIDCRRPPRSFWSNLLNMVVRIMDFSGLGPFTASEKVCFPSYHVWIFLVCKLNRFLEYSVS